MLDLPAGAMLFAGMRMHIGSVLASGFSSNAANQGFGCCTGAMGDSYARATPPRRNHASAVCPCCAMVHQAARMEHAAQCSKCLLLIRTSMQAGTRLAVYNIAGIWQTQMLACTS